MEAPALPAAQIPDRVTVLQNMLDEIYQVKARTTALLNNREVKREYAKKKMPMPTADDINAQTRSSEFILETLIEQQERILDLTDQLAQMKTPQISAPATGNDHQGTRA